MANRVYWKSHFYEFIANPSVNFMVKCSRRREVGIFWPWDLKKTQVVGQFLNRIADIALLSLSLSYGLASFV